MNEIAKRIVVCVIVSILCAALASTSLCGEPRAAHWPFFAFDNGVGRGQLAPEQQAQLLAELGYDGIGYTGVDNIPAMLKALRDRKLKMFSTYIKVDLSDNNAPFDPTLPAAIRQLEGEGTALWLHVHGDKSPSKRQDQKAVELIRKIADMAARANLPVVLYPHTGFYVATTRDAVRIAKLVDRPNVGASFNLCHFLKQNDAQTLPQVLDDAMPYLKLVSINGADAGETTKMTWAELIQTLDRGSFDVGQVLKRLRQGGYQGPIGLQCYAIKGDVRKNLDASIRAWRKLNSVIRQSRMSP